MKALFRYLRTIFCHHRFKKTNRINMFLIFSDSVWECEKCGWEVSRFNHRDPNNEGIVGRHEFSAKKRRERKQCKKEQQCKS